MEDGGKRIAPISAVSSRVAAVEADGAQPAADPVGLVDDGRRPIFISSYAVTIPERPPPMTATSVPCSVAGTSPRPAGWARKSS